MQQQFRCIAVRFEHSVSANRSITDQETIEIGAHCQHELDRTRRVLRNLDERGDKACAQLLVGNHEDFFELIDEDKPLVAFLLEPADKPARRVRLRIEQLAGLRLAKPAALKRAA